MWDQPTRSARLRQEAEVSSYAPRCSSLQRLSLDYCLADWAEIGRSAMYTFLYVV